MDLLEIILDPKKLKSSCFLCLKYSEKMICVFKKIFIHTEYKVFDECLIDLITDLLPLNDMLSDQVCTECSNLLIKMFTAKQKNIIRKTILHEIAQGLADQIINIKDYSTGKTHLKFKLPIYKEIVQKKITNKSKEEITKQEPLLNSDQIEMMFPTDIVLQKHVKTSHKPPSMASVCDICGKDCIKPATLRAHLNSHKEKMCPVCTKTLKSHSHFKLHVKNHTTQIKRQRINSYYRCNMCPYKSMNKKSLEAHMNKVHLDIRPYICNVCGKGFYKKSNLTEHSSVHNKDKNMTCEQCGENFFNKKTLVEHIRLHTGEKPFQCEICNAHFVTSGRRSDHFKRRHMVKSFLCFVCEKKFSLKKELNTHMKKFHGQRVSDEIHDAPNNLFIQT